MRLLQRLAPVWACLAFLCLPLLAHAAPATGTLKTPGYNVADCYDCHKEVQGFHEGSAHKTVACHECHEGLPAHVVRLSEPAAVLARPAGRYVGYCAELASAFPQTGGVYVFLRESFSRR